MANVLTVSASELPQMPDGFSGITYTQPRMQPYAVWRYGRIISYARDEPAAQDILRDATSRLRKRVDSLEQRRRAMRGVA